MCVVNRKTIYHVLIPILFTKKKTAHDADPMFVYTELILVKHKSVFWNICNKHAPFHVITTNCPHPKETRNNK